MSNILRYRSTHSGRLERWLGKEQLADISSNMKGWYYNPIHLLNCPGSVRVSADGDFIGPFEHGVFMSAVDSLECAVKRALKTPKYSFNTGFTSISDALSRGSGGFSRKFPFNKAGPTGVVAVTTSLHKVGAQPIAGAASAAPPGGTAFVDSDTGGFTFDNPAAGSYRLTGADVVADRVSTLLLYDRIFGVAKTPSSVSTEAVTGDPTRYQSTTATAEDYIGGNFGFIEVGTAALGATAHNWTVCLYEDEAAASSTLPTVTGNSGAIAHRLDQPASTWFVPLASGDRGIRAWTQLQNSASVTGAVDFVIGHPLGFMTLPLINGWFPFDWLTNRDQAPRIFADAYLAFLDLTKVATNATNFNGVFYMTSTSS